MYGNERFYAAISALLKAAREDREVGPYSQQLRITPSVRTLPDWSQVEVEWEALRHPLSSIVATLNDVADGLASYSDESVSPAEDLALAIRNTTRSLGEIHANLERMVFEPDSHIIYWGEVSSVQGRVSLHAAPLEVGPLVERHLWHEKDCIIMTSATLTAAGEFDYLRRRLSADEAEELALGSPFDFETSTLLYLINDIPEPADRKGYQQAVERGLVRLCRASRGRALALFTSYEQLRRTARAIAEPRRGWHPGLRAGRGRLASRPPGELSDVGPSCAHGHSLLLGRGRRPGRGPLRARHHPPPLRRALGSDRRRTLRELRRSVQ
jgi:DNA polymerase-3 subunit epsilon/ATP-dependent DNA helicase DinG